MANQGLWFVSSNRAHACHKSSEYSISNSKFFAGFFFRNKNIFHFKEIDIWKTRTFQHFTDYGLRLYACGLMTNINHTVRCCFFNNFFFPFILNSRFDAVYHSLHSPKWNASAFPWPLCFNIVGVNFLNEKKWKNRMWITR